MQTQVELLKENDEAYEDFEIIDQFEVRADLDDFIILKNLQQDAETRAGVGRERDGVLTGEAEIDESHLNLFFDPNLETEIEPQLFGEEALYFSQSFFARRKSLCSKYAAILKEKEEAEKVRRREERA